MENYDIVITGGGIAGLTAGIYALRNGKKVLVIDKKGFGGQIVEALEVENYPGFENISGYELAQRIYNQFLNFGGKIISEEAIKIEDGEYKKILTDKNIYFAKGVIIASGAEKRKLGLKKEEKFIGKGLSYCALCDGGFFKGKTVAVNGGGNTAFEDALYLSSICKKVYIIHRRSEFRAEKELVKRAEETENIKFFLNKKVSDLEGEEFLESIVAEDIETKEKEKIFVSGLFVAIGQRPDSERFSNVVELNEEGYIKIYNKCKTKTKGVFAAGDCCEGVTRQLVIAAALGAEAGTEVCRFIDEYIWL